MQLQIQIRISIGDSSECSVSDSFQGIYEIHPGNFAYYDLMQWKIGACTLDEIAVTVACPVIAKHRQQKKIVLYGGAVHLSMEMHYVEIEIYSNYL